MQLSYGYLDLCKKTNPYPLRDNQLNICRAFNLDVQYPHVIDTSMTIHMQGEQNTLSKSKNKKKTKQKEFIKREYCIVDVQRRWH